MTRLAEIRQRVTEALDCEMESMVAQIREQADRLHDPRLREIVLVYCDQDPAAARQKLEEILRRVGA